jgi:hypothetical protein
MAVNIPTVIRSLSPKIKKPVWAGSLAYLPRFLRGEEKITAGYFTRRLFAEGENFKYLWLGFTYK